MASLDSFEVEENTTPDAFACSRAKKKHSHFGELDDSVDSSASDSSSSSSESEDGKKRKRGKKKGRSQEEKAAARKMRRARRQKRNAKNKELAKQKRRARRARRQAKQQKRRQAALRARKRRGGVKKARGGRVVKAETTPEGDHLEVAPISPEDAIGGLSLAEAAEGPAQKEEQAVGAAGDGEERLPVTPTRTKLLDDVFIDKYMMARPDGYIFEWVVVNHRLNQLEVNLNFEGTTNFDLGGDVSQTTVLKQYETKRVGRIVQIDIYAASSLGLGYSVKTMPPNEELLAQEAKAASAAVDDNLAAIESLGLGDVAALPLDELQAKLESSGTHFVDITFPPKMQSVTGPEKTDLDIEWRRAKDFMQNYTVFKGIDPNDISQGRLGNCWFCCSISSVAEFPNLVEDIFHTKEANQTGLYRLTLHKNGQPVHVTVDDWFPCYPGAGPIFSSNRGAELWVLLLEKAYAKIHGAGYLRLASGNCSEGLADLTGLPTEYYSFTEAATKASIDDGSFWQTMKLLGAQDQLMAAGTPGKDTYTEMGIDPDNDAGLVGGHAYTVLHCAEPLPGVKLVQLRNPWGRFEWKGAYSDHSPEWTDELKSLVQPTFSDEDGIFWMSYEDFLKFFTSLNVCYRVSPAGKTWNHGHREVGSFRHDAAAEEPVAVSSFYEIEVTHRNSSYFFGVHQQDKRQEGSPPYIDMGVIVMNANHEVVADSGLEIAREAQVAVTLQPGKYTVFPYTSGCKMAVLGVAEREFIMTVHADDATASELSRVPADPAELKRALKDDILETATKRSVGAGIDVYTYWNGRIWSLAVHVTEDLPTKGVQLTFDVSGSRNAQSNRASPQHSWTGYKGDFHIYHSLGSVDSKQSLSCSYGMSGAYVN